MEVDLSLVTSATLARLIDEVKNEDLTVGGRYDRTHNKHNR
ncbi:YhhA family cyclophane-containing RiPP [Chromobacterium amazonense]